MNSGDRSVVVLRLHSGCNNIVTCMNTPANLLNTARVKRLQILLAKRVRAGLMSRRRQGRQACVSSVPPPEWRRQARPNQSVIP
jgi:hypothetical protein